MRNREEIVKMSMLKVVVTPVLYRDLKGVSFLWARACCSLSLISKDLQKKEVSEFDRMLALNIFQKLMYY